MLVVSRRAAFAAALVLAGVTGAYADQVTYTAKLDGASETPPNDTKGTGTVDAKYRHGDEDAELDGDLFRPDWSRDNGAFPRPGAGREGRWGDGADEGFARQPVQRFGHAHRRAGQGADRGHDVFQCPHRRA